MEHLNHLLISLVIWSRSKISPCIVYRRLFRSVGERHLFCTKKKHIYCTSYVLYKSTVYTMHCDIEVYGATCLEQHQQRDEEKKNRTETVRQQETLEEEVMPSRAHQHQSAGRQVQKRSRDNGEQRNKSRKQKEIEKRDMTHDEMKQGLASKTNFTGFILESKLGDERLW